MSDVPTSWEDPARVTDSPDRSVAEHVARYLATDGRDGYREGGVPNLVLTTVGRRSGVLRRTALFFGEDDGRWVLVASGSVAGARHPQWYLNAVAHPEVHVQVRGERFLARARTTVGPERERLWRLMTGLAPVYHRYAAVSPREIPVVVLERVTAPAAS
jgi:deazaflavin-dependent oxidoreductase (nitroreductase family)